MSHVEAQLQAARNRLLDLTMRNRLLNFRPTKVRTIRIQEAVVPQIFEALVIQERALEFRSKVTTLSTSGVEVNTETESVNEIISSTSLFTLPEDTPQTNENSHDTLEPLAQNERKAPDVERYLYTAIAVDSLAGRLFAIDHEAQLALEEKGYNILFLSLGFLEWRESPQAQESRRAPLVLVPIALSRAGVGKPYKARWTGGAIDTNISLQSVLAEHGVTLPAFETPEDGSGLMNYYKAVEQAINGKPGWRVTEEAYLDFFSFAKFVMYKDLDPAAWPEGHSPAQHTLIQALLAPGSESHAGNGKQGFAENEVDTRLKVRDMHHVLDADPSQIAVIEDVKAGHSLVVEGPPGTGKSQTIVNLIGELLMQGKTVLFVSDKAAAIRVVRDRLNHVGLGDFCLEFHEQAKNEKAFRQELERVLHATPNASVFSDDEFDELERRRDELNQYAEALRTPIGGMTLSPFTLYGMKETARRQFAQTGCVPPRIRLTGVEACTSSAWNAACDSLKALTDALPGIAPLSGHPWRGCDPGVLLPADEQEIAREVEDCAKFLRTLEAALDRLVALCAMERPTRVVQLERAFAAARVMIASQPIDREVLLNAEWNRPSREANELIVKLEAFQRERAVALEHFPESVLEQNLSALRDEYQPLAAKTFRFFSGRYRQLKRDIRALYRNAPPSEDSRLLSDLEQAIACTDLRSGLRAAQGIGQAYFGSHWQAESGNPQMLLAFAEWMVTFRRQLLDHALTDRAVDVASSGVSAAEMQTATAEADEAAKMFLTRRDALFERLAINHSVVFGTSSNDARFADIAAHFEIWQANVARLPRWSRFVAQRKACLQTLAAPLMEQIEADALTPEQLLACWQSNYADEMLRIAFAARPSLTHFIGDLHERNIARFQELDRRSIMHNRTRLAQTLYARRPPVRSGSSPGSEAGILLGEFQRKRGHMPLRKLMGQVGGLIQKIKPCFMMNPQAIAQYLDPRTVTFDVIVFDEASQVRPEDALGALLRGRQLVVMGDTRQLPPTNFFDRLVQADDSEEDPDASAMITDVESILHQCKRSFPEKTLRWHYRSRHESLIAVSNQEFYNNNLLIFPSSVDSSETLGLRFIHLPDAVYDRGRSSVNRREAQVVAQAALAHYRAYPQKTLGIGTFNIRQRDAILEELDRLLQSEAELQTYFKSDTHEYCFVKNLENIQGDERDVIFISMGYGFDANRKLSLNFGPLNSEGGWRRLNVLITRARERCVVYSNFRARDLAVEGSGLGLKALKTFLEYAESRQLRSAETTRVDADSPFEEAVDAFLGEHGHIVRRQVGCAGFRVDLAIVDPEAPGRYIIGIECDGAPYHSSLVARERDRLRQQILESMEWRIYRIWSTDWYRNREEAERNLLTAVGTAVQEKDRVPAYAPEPIKSPEEPDSAAVMPTTVTPDVYEVAVSTPYVACTSLGISTRGDLHETSIPNLATAVLRVVEVEGPIHIDEVIRRIRILWGLGRAGERIRKAIQQATEMAEQNRKIVRRGDFLWIPEDQTMVARTRSGDPPARIELICDEEIGQAVQNVLAAQHATLPPDLVVAASRLLGFQVTHEGTAKRISIVIDSLLQSGALLQRPNGMVDRQESVGR